MKLHNSLLSYQIEFLGYSENFTWNDQYYDQIINAIRWCQNNFGSSGKRWNFDMRSGLDPCLFYFKYKKHYLTFKMQWC